jgi:restriction system protein
MARRRKSKESDIFEAVIGMVGLVLFPCFLVPGFCQFVLSLLVIAAISGGVGLVIWITFKKFKPEPASSTFRTFTSVTSAPYQTEQPIHRKPPTVYVEELRPAKPAPEPTISEKLHKIDWFQFEKLIELIYRHRGFSVKRLGGANADDGVDLMIESSTDKFVVQCKHWRKWTVGVRHIREFLGTMTDSKISKGIFITLVGYSGEAKQLADKHAIQILNETDIIKMLDESGLMYSKEISALFADKRKFCPKCEAEMVVRTNRQNGNKFWGCQNYPRCRFILNIEV